MEENQNNQGVTTPETEPQAQPTTNQVSKPTQSDTQNLDVLLQDPKLQAEFDKKLGIINLADLIDLKIFQKY